MSALFDGIPMIYGVENLQEAIQKYNVTLVVLASTVIPSEARSRIQKVCNELGIEVQDYSGFFQMHSGLTLKELSGYCSGAVEVVANGDK